MTQSRRVPTAHQTANLAPARVGRGARIAAAAVFGLIPVRLWAQPATAADTARRAAVAGVAWDSTAGGPLAGATVQLVNPREPAVSRSTVADSLGRWRIDGVAPGEWALGFVHPTLDLLGIESPLRAVAVSGRDSITHVNVWAPGPATVRALLCRGDAVRRDALRGDAGDSTGALVGVVREAERDVPPADAKVVVSWEELVVGRSGITRTPHRVPVPVRAGGMFAICGVSADGTVFVSAEAPGLRSGVIEVHVAPGGAVRRDLTLDSSATRAVASGPTVALTARGRARLTGVVRDTAGSAVPGVRLSVEGTSAVATSGVDGTFTLDSLPAGTWSLEARAVGWTPVRRPVDLSARGALTVSLVLRDRVPQLAAVNVKAKANAMHRFGPALTGGFYDRMHTRVGHFVTPEVIDSLKPLRTTDVLRTILGISVQTVNTYNSGIRTVVRMRGGVGVGCTPLVVVNGIAVQGGANEIDDLVSSVSIAAVEVYQISEVPIEYGGSMTNQCGAVMLWTR